MSEKRDPSRAEPGSVSAARLFAELIERERRGERPDPHEIAADHPDVARELAEGMAMLAEIDDAFGDSNAGQVIGDFRILAEIGRGGMGIVYEANQLSLGRRVALKVLPLASMFDEKQVIRFQNEARAAAQLDHPNIVPVYAVGHDRGIHYYAMRYVRGESLRQVLARVRQAPDPESGEPPSLPSSWPKTVAGWIRQAADALEHSHQLGVLHRDVKPGNLLLEPDGQISVTDFGLARSLRLDRAGLTMSGEMLGTLAYCCPEQVSGQRGAVDQRADVYSLGATLYELLTLRTHHVGRDRAELLHKITRESPRPPRRIDRRIPSDLETITLRALALEPEHRYQTAGELAADLGAFLAGGAIQARRTTAAERLWRWSRHNPGLSLAVGIATMLAAIVVAVGFAWREATVQRDRARHAESQVRVVQGLASARAVLSERRAGRRADALRHVADAVDALVQADLPREATRQWELELRGAAVAALGQMELTESTDPTWGSEFASMADPGFRYLARIHRDGGVTIERAGRPDTRFSVPGSSRDACGFRFAPDGTKFAFIDRGVVHVVDVEDETVGATLEPFRGVHAMDFLPDGAGILAIDADGALIECATSGGEARLAGRILDENGDPETGVLDLRLSADARRMAVRTRTESLRVHDRTGRFLASVSASEGAVTASGWTTRGLLATGGADGLIRLWDVEDMQLLALAEGHSGVVVEIACDLDLPLLASRSWDNTTRLWHAEDLTPLAMVPGGSVDFASLGARQLGPISDARSGVARTYRITPSTTHRTFHHRDAPATDTPVAVLDPRHGVLAALSLTGVALFDVATGRVLRHVEVGEYPVSAVFEGSGRTLFVGAHDGCWRLDLEFDGYPRIARVRTTKLLDCNDRCEAALLSTGRLLVTDRGRMRLLDPDTLTTEHLETAETDAVVLEVSPDERWAVTGSWNHKGAVVWDLSTGRVARRVGKMQCRVQFDSRNRLWLSDGDGVTVVEPGSWRQVHRIDREHHDVPSWIAFDSATGIVAITESRGTVQLRRFDDLELLVDLEPDPPCGLHQPQFSEDGRWLVAGSQRRIAHAWNIPEIRRQLDRLGLDW